MNSIKTKINITSSQIDDIYYYEWKNNSDITIIFVGGAFVTIQSYFDFLDHISNDLNAKVIAIPLLYQDHSSFKMLDFSFEKQKKIIDKIVHKVTFADSKTIYIGIDIGASIGLYLNHEFTYYYLINPFSEWNPLIQNKLFHKISQIPLLYEFIKEYLIKFITFNIFFRIPPKFLTHLLFQHSPLDANARCQSCKTDFDKDPNKPSEILSYNNYSNPNPYNVIEFSSLNTFFEIGVFYDIEEKLRVHQKKINLFFNENTITNIKHFFEIAKKCNIHNLYSLSEFQSNLYELFQKKTDSKILKHTANTESTPARASRPNITPSTERFPKKNENLHNNFYLNPNINNQNTQSNTYPNHTNTNGVNNHKNISALPPFLFNQPPSNPLQPLLDLFQNNSSYPQSNDYGMFQNPNQNPNHYPQHPNPHQLNHYPRQLNSHSMGPNNINPMQNYLNGISGTNLYNSQMSVNPFNHMNPQQKNPFNIQKPNHMQNPNINYSTGNI